MNRSASDLNRLGISHAKRREFREAIECFRQAISADTSFVDGHLNLGNVLAVQGEFTAAKASYQEALTLSPDLIVLHLNLGEVHLRLEDYMAAIAAYQRAIKIDPNCAAGHAGLGIAFAGLRSQAEAISAFRRAIQLNPKSAGAHSNLALALLHSGDYEGAVKSCEDALRLQPYLAAAHHNYGLALVELGRFDDALLRFKIALDLNSDYPEAHCSDARALFEVGRFGEALAHFDAALRLRPDYRDAILGRAVVLLLLGDYAKGWREFDRRIEDKAVVPTTYDAPLWDGSPLADRTLLLEAEQGLGDTIQFIRYAQEINRCHQGRIIVAVQPQLVPLLSDIAGADVVMSREDPRPPFDVWAPLLSLPRVMGDDPTCFPAPIPYLSAEPSRVEKWKPELAHIRGLRIGIAWQGNLLNGRDRHRSFPLNAFLPIAQLPHVTLITLQKGDGTDQLNRLTDFEVHTLGDDFDASGGAFLDTAAVMQSLDLVISADTAIAHLAGALGVPVWLPLAFVPDWRWTMEGSTTSAYPTMRLFRQPKPGDWSSVFQQMATELAAMTSNRQALKDGS